VDLVRSHEMRNAESRRLSQNMTSRAGYAPKQQTTTEGCGYENCGTGALNKEPV